MTTRTELLEAVAEALVLTLPLAKGCAAENRSMINRGVILQAEDALAALDAHRAEPAGEVVKIGVWEDTFGGIALFRAGSSSDLRPVPGWGRIGTITLPTIAAEVVR